MEVLQRQHGRGDEHGDLLSVHDRLEGSPHGHLGLAVADIAADQPVHRLRPLHICLDLPDGCHLICRLLKGEGSLKLPLPGGIRGASKSFGYLPCGIKLYEFPGHFANGGPDPFLCPRPRVRSQTIQRGSACGGVGTDIALDEVEFVDRDVELIATRILQQEAIAFHLTHRDLLQSVKPANAMVQVNHHISWLQILESVESAGLSNLWPPNGDPPTRAEDLGLREIGLLERRKVEASAESPFKDMDPSGGGRPVGDGRPDVMLAKDLTKALGLGRPPGHQADGTSLSTPDPEIAYQGGEPPLVRRDPFGLKNERRTLLPWGRRERKEVDPGPGGKGCVNFLPPKVRRGERGKSFRFMPLVLLQQEGVSRLRLGHHLVRVVPDENRPRAKVLPQGDYVSIKVGKIPLHPWPGPRHLDRLLYERRGLPRRPPPGEPSRLCAQEDLRERKDGHAVHAARA